MQELDIIEKTLLSSLEMAKDNKYGQAVILQSYIATYGPLRECVAEKVRELTE